MPYTASKIPAPHTKNSIVILAAIVIYFVLFFSLFKSVGDPIAAFSFIPIALIGWYFGKNYGILSGLFFFVINLFLKLLISNISTDDLTKSIPPFIISIIIGFSAGKLRNFLIEVNLQSKNLQDQIIERERLEIEIKKSEEKYRNLIENLNEIVFKLTYDKRALFFNNMWTKATGFSLEESIGTDFSDYIFIEDRLEVDKLFSDLVIGKIESIKKKIRLKLKNNSIRWFELNAVLVNEHGSTHELSCSLIDLNDLVKAEEVLTLKLEFDSLINTISSSFINLDAYLIEKEIILAIKRLNSFIKADSFYLYLSEPGNSELLLKKIHSEAVIGNDFSYSNRIEIKKLQWSLNYFMMDKIIYIKDKVELPENASYEISILFNSDIKSGIIIPLIEKSNLIGLFGFSFRDSLNEINAEILQSLKSVSSVFINALNRKKNEDAIIKLNRELKNNVAERTIDLEQTVKKLNSEIKEKAIIEDKLQGKIYRLQFLKSLYEKFEVAIDLASIFNTLYSSLSEYKKVSRVSLLLYDKTTNSLVSDSILGYHRTTESFTSNTTQPIGQSISGKCFQEKQLIYIPDCSTTSIIPKFYVDYYKLKSSIAIPILYSNSIKGVIRIDNTEITSAFSEDDIEFFIMVSDIVGIVIENAMLFIEYNKMLKELMDGEQRYKMLFDANPHPILVYNNESLIFHMVNQAAIKMYGYTEEEFKSLTFLDIHPDEEIYDYLRSPNNSEENNNESGIWRHKLKDGTFIYVEVVSHSIKYDNMNAKLLIATNITDRKIAEDHLTKYIGELQNSKSLIEKNAKDLSVLNDRLFSSEKRLRELNANKDKFFSIISHDLRTPFNSILGFSDFLVTELETLTPEEIRSYAQSINKSSRNLVNLLNNVLEWSRVQTGRLKNSPSKFEIKETIEEVVGILKGNALLKEIEIENYFECEMDVYADKNAVISILQNIITNSLKFTFNGGRIKVHLKKVKDFAQIEIEDNGIGLKEEDLKKLFRIDVTHTTLGTNNEDGTGLGLILCKELIEKNGGEIWVESIPRVKTKFGFTLPLA